MHPTHRPFLSLLLCLAMTDATAAAQRDKTREVARDGPRLSPFGGVRAVKDGLEVQVADDAWFALESLAGIDTATLLARSKELCGHDWWKRITEDLPALLAAMDLEVGTTVDLQLREPATGRTVTLAGVPMTEVNRARLLAANQAGAAPDGAPPEAAPATLAVADARTDLADLRRLLDERFAYRELRKLDLDALFADAAHRLSGDRVSDDRGAAVERTQLLREVDRILRALGDGHSRLAAGQLPPGSGYLPFLVQRAQGGFVAFRADRSALLDVENPFVDAIDGVPLERWHAAARARATQGSPALRERETERGLRELAELRTELGMQAAPDVRVTLRGNGGAEVSLAVARRPPVYGPWPRAATRLLADNVGYLRLSEMSGDAAFLDGIDAAMATFRGTRGLIVDVRGNGGGSREALRRLFPYLLAPGDPPQVANVAAALLAAGRPSGADADGLLADRGLRPLEWRGWSDAQRAAITQFLRAFQPEWKLPQGRFSPWHFLVLDRTDNPKAYPYDKPVRVLIDGGCFSATDVFAAALRTRPQVRLVGTATSGGSGRPLLWRLPRSGIALQLSSMASFRPDGLLFDGRGVEPDVRCEPLPGDFVGKGDAVLDAALASLQ
jgi:hypothetical protein